MHPMTLDSIAKEMVHHFFENSPIWDTECSPSSTLLAWPYVRHLVYDQLRPTLKIGNPRHSNVQYKDKFLQGLVDESKKLAGFLPPNISTNDWLIITKSAYDFLMNDKLVNDGLVSKRGQSRLLTQTIIGSAESPSIDQYEDFWEKQKKANETLAA